MVTAVCWGVVSVLMIGSIETGLNEISEYCEQRDAPSPGNNEGERNIKCEKSQVHSQLLSMRGVPATQ